MCKICIKNNKFCKYCKKDNDYRRCNICYQVFLKKNFYIVGNKTHICSNGETKTINYRRKVCNNCYLFEQKNTYHEDKQKRPKPQIKLKKKKKIINVKKPPIRAIVVKQTPAKAMVAKDIPIKAIVVKQNIPTKTIIVAKEKSLIINFD